MPTGEVEVHVQNILRVQKIYNNDLASNRSVNGKR